MRLLSSFWKKSILDLDRSRGSSAMVFDEKCSLQHTETLASATGACTIPLRYIEAHCVVLCHDHVEQ